MSSNQKPTVPSSLINQVLPLLDRFGFDREAFLSELGFSGNHIQQDLITLEQLFALAQKGREMVDIPFMGLVIGSNYNLSTFGMAGMSALTQQTLGDCLKVGARFAEHICPAIAVNWVEHGDMVGLRLEENFALGEFNTNVAEVFFSSLYENFLYLTNNEHSLHSVQFTFKAPKYAQIYEQYFKCDINYHADHTEFLIPRHLMDFPLYLANIDTARKAENQFYSLAPDSVSLLLLSRIKKLIKVKIADSPGIKVQYIGDELGMSGRTLRRRLSEIGTCPTEMIEQVKKELAIQSLKQVDSSITEISYALDFSDSSAFCKTFKKWTGLAPTDFRQSYLEKEAYEANIEAVEEYLDNESDFTREAYNLIMKINNGDSSSVGRVQ